MVTRGIDNVKKLLSIQEVSKDLGIPKSGVQALIDNQQLLSVDVGGKAYITTASLTKLVAQNAPTTIGEEDNGYPAPEEVSCPLTKKELVNTQEKAGATMECKGSISVLKDGRFMVQIDKGKTPDGKRVRESKGFRDEALAQEYLEKRLSELNRGVSPATGQTPPAAIPTVPQANYTPLTFEDYSFRVLSNGIGGGTTRTQEGYRRGLAIVVKYIGKKPMIEIAETDLRKMFETMRFKHVKSTMTRCFNITKMIMERAFDNGDIPTYPMRKMKCLSSKKPIKKATSPTYSDEDIKVIFDTSKKHSQELHTMFTVLECTGMRPGELRGLEWSAFNAEVKTIDIRQAVTTEYEEIKTIKKASKCKEILSVTKSEYGIRTMQLSDLAVQALQDWRKTLDKGKNIKQRDSLFIFSDRNGSWKTETSCQTNVQRYRKKYDLDNMGVTFYKFRHTMCTRLILDGQPISVIQRIMGDNTTDVIMKIYTHVNAEQAMKATEGFYDNLNKKHQEIA